MKKSFFKGKSKRTRLFSLITVLLIAGLLFLNIFVRSIGIQGLVYLDMTPEGFYTMTDKMEEVCRELLETKEGEEEKDIKIIFCTDPDYILRSTEARVTYFMSLALRNRFDNVTVETVNVQYNPTAVATYKTTSREEIKPTDVIISCGARYRIVSLDSFWISDTEGNSFSYNGEYKLATILASLTAINAPAAYFVTDHGETYYDPDSPDAPMSIETAYFADLLTECGLRIKTLSLSDPALERIPEDCALLIINNPTSDLRTDKDGYGTMSYVSEAEKIDRYLVNELGSLIVNKPYDSEPFPVLESLLSEWGIGFGEGLVKDDEREYSSPTDELYNLLGVYDTDNENYGSAFYGEYASLSSAPDMLFKESGYLYCTFSGGDSVPESGSYNTSRDFASFIGTTDKAIATAGRDDTAQTAAAGFKSLAAVAARTYLDGTTTENDFSYIFASNSEYFFSNEILGNASFSNYDIMRSVISNLSRTDRHVTIDLGGSSPNSTSYGGKQIVDMTLKDYAHDIYSPDGKEVVKTNRGFSESAQVWFTIIALIAPVSAFTVGCVVFIKRKFL